MSGEPADERRTGSGDEVGRRRRAGVGVGVGGGGVAGGMLLDAARRRWRRRRVPRPAGRDRRRRGRTTVARRPTPRPAARRQGQPLAPAHVAAGVQPAARAAAVGASMVASSPTTRPRGRPSGVDRATTWSTRRACPQTPVESMRQAATRGIVGAHRRRGVEARREVGAGERRRRVTVYEPPANSTGPRAAGSDDRVGDAASPSAGVRGRRRPPARRRRRRALRRRRRLRLTWTRAPRPRASRVDEQGDGGDEEGGEQGKALLAARRPRRASRGTPQADLPRRARGLRRRNG